MKIIKKIWGVLKWIGLFVCSIIFTQLIQYWITGVEETNLLSWTINQLNPLSWTLLLIIIFLTIYEILKPIIDNRGLTIEDKLEFAKAVKQSELNPEEKKENEIVKKIVEEIKNDKKLKVEFEKVVAKINNYEGSYSDVDTDALKYFFKNDLIQALNRSPLRGYNHNDLTQRGKKVRDELI